MATPPQTNSTLASLPPALDQFIKEEQAQYPTIAAAIPAILHAIAWAGQVINKAISKGSLAGVVGSQGTFNASGDEQQKLDVIAHNSFVRTLEATAAVCAIISEEAKDVVALASKAGEYILALDPIDGSANVQVNAPSGTIFSIYQRISPSPGPVQQADVLQPGSRQIAAGYILYSTSTILVYTTTHGVHGFTYEPAMDAFFLTHQAIKLPQAGPTYAINDSHQHSFPEYVQRYVQHCRSQGLTARYTGALVADFHRHLLQGGIYLYPPTPKNPTGKLRLMFECNALAFIAEQAGGMASNGAQPILHLVPKTIHQRTPLYMGSIAMVKSLLSLAS